MNWIEKWFPPFMMGTTRSTTMQSLGEIEQRSLAVGEKWCLSLRFYRQDAAKRQTASIKFTHWPKIRFFAPQGRLLALNHVKLGTTDGQLGPLGCAKFYLNQHRGECTPENIKKLPLFRKESPTGANLLTDI